MAACDIIKFYTTGVSEFDEDHFNILVLIDKLAYSETTDDVTKTLEAIITEVINHTKKEEDFLEKINFSQTEYHKVAHREMIREIGDLADIIRNRDRRFIALEISKIIDILKNHIEWCDIPYGEYVKQLDTQNTSTTT